MRVGACARMSVCKCMCVCECVGMWSVCMYGYMGVWTYGRTDVCVCMCLYVPLCLYVCMYVCMPGMHVCMRACYCTHVHVLNCIITFICPHIIMIILMLRKPMITSQHIILLQKVVVVLHLRDAE